MGLYFNRIIGQSGNKLTPIILEEIGIESGATNGYAELEIGIGIIGVLDDTIEISANVYEVEFTLSNEHQNQNQITQSLQSGTYIICNSGDASLKMRIISTIKDTSPYKTKCIVESLIGNINEFDSSKTIDLFLIYKKIN